MNAKRLTLTMVILVAMIVLIGIVCKCTLAQSDATIERIDRKIEMYERSR